MTRKDVTFRLSSPSCLLENLVIGSTDFPRRTFGPIGDTARALSEACRVFNYFLLQQHRRDVRSVWQSREHSGCLLDNGRFLEPASRRIKIFQSEESRGSVTQWRHVLMGLVGLLWRHTGDTETRPKRVPTHVSCLSGCAVLGVYAWELGRPTTKLPLHNPDIYRYLLRHFGRGTHQAIKFHCLRGDWLARGRRKAKLVTKSEIRGEPPPIRRVLLETIAS